MRSHLVAAVLVAAIAFAAHAAPSPSFTIAQPTRSNPHRLSTEKEFDAFYQRTIWPWFLASEQGQFAGQRGVMLHYRAFLQKDRAREKGAIVISSGRTEGLIIYPELLHDLWKQNYSVYIHDHRGQGFSGGRIVGKQRGDVDAFDNFVSDLETFVDTIVRPRNHRKLFLLAHSMGGGIASLYLEKRPEVFAAAVLVAPMHDPLLPGPVTGKDRTWLLCGGSWLVQKGFTPHEYAIGQKDYARFPFAHPNNDLTHSEARWEHTRNIYDRWRGARVGGPTHRWIRQACDAAKRARANADDVTIPILIVQAGSDTAVRNEAQEEFCKKAPHCRGVTIPGALHALFLERDDFRLATLNATIDFLNRESGR